MPKALLSQSTLNYSKQGSWSGAMRPLVFVHGLAASSAFWFGVTQALPPDWPVLTYDLRGHGRSVQTADGYTSVRMADDLLELLEYLEVGPCHLCGHSFGGSIALRAALVGPEKFVSLALADTRIRMFQPLLTPVSWKNWEKRRELFAGIGVVIRDDEPDAGVRLLTELARLQVEDSRHAESQMPSWIGEFLGQRPSLFSANRWLDLTNQTTILADITDESWLTEGGLAALSPALFAVYGGDSPVYPSGLKLAEMLPGTDFRTIPQAGHFFPTSRPKEVAGLLTDFLQTYEHCA